MQTNLIVNADCIDYINNHIEPNSVDFICCDLPYGVTHNDWDVLIPFDKLWDAFNRVCKPNATVALFGMGLFGAKVVLSNPKKYRWSYSWFKPDSHGGFLSIKTRPLTQNEEIHVFRLGKARDSIYNPQFTQASPEAVKKSEKLNKRFAGKEIKTTSYANRLISPANRGKNKPNNDDTFRHPTTHLSFPNGSINHQTAKIHPTQKPIDLIKYLVKTFSNEGSVVLDPTAGSCVLAHACRDLNRQFICIEKDKENYDKAVEWFNRPYQEQLIID